MGLCGSKNATSGAHADVGTNKTVHHSSHQQKKSNGKHAKHTSQDQTTAAEAAVVSNHTNTTTTINNVLSDKPDLNDAQADKTSETKLLLLGSAESGKSTVFQQLKIIHQDGFTKDERLNIYKPVIYGNLIEITSDLINALIKFDNQNLVENFQIDILQDFVRQSKAKDKSATDHLTNDQIATIGKILNSKLTRSLIDGPHSSDFYLMDSATYFINHLNRIIQSDYIPIDQDILYSRQQTCGIYDAKISLDSTLTAHIYDVGGQRTERKQWIHCFNNVTLVIFCVSLSEYDQQLLEDKSQSRIQESLVLFDNVINSRWFARTSVVLFLNKIDLFAKKIQKKPLENYFSDYTGGQDINKAVKYMLWRFAQLNRANLNIYPHVTQATDTSNIELVFDAVKETVLQNKLKDSGLL